jgi:hypothetical protein
MSYKDSNLLMQLKISLSQDHHWAQQPTLDDWVPYESIRCFSPSALNVILRNSSSSYRLSCHTTDLWPMHQDGKYSILVRWVVVGNRVKAEVGVSGFLRKWSPLNEKYSFVLHRLNILDQLPTCMVLQKGQQLFDYSQWWQGPPLQ